MVKDGTSVSMPFAAAGTRIEPPTSEPMPKGVAPGCQHTCVATTASATRKIRDDWVLSPAKDVAMGLGNEHGLGSIGFGDDDSTSSSDK